MLNRESISGWQLRSWVEPPPSSLLTASAPGTVSVRVWNEGYPKVPEDFTITEKAPTRAFFWLKALSVPYDNCVSVPILRLVVDSPWLRTFVWTFVWSSNIYWYLLISTWRGRPPARSPTCRPPPRSRAPPSAPPPRPRPSAAGCGRGPWCRNPPWWQSSVRSSSGWIQ